MKPLRVKMLCQTCKRSGLHAFGNPAKPRWCRCTKSTGPIVMAPGVVVMVRFEDKADAEFRERCRLAGNAEHDARHAWRDGRWVKCGKGYRQLPDTAPKAIALAKAHDHAIAALEVLQAQCPHKERCRFEPTHCGVCYAHVESDIEHYRHLVREGFYDAAAE